MPLNAVIQAARAPPFSLVAQLPSQVPHHLLQNRVWRAYKAFHDICGQDMNRRLRHVHVFASVISGTKDARGSYSDVIICLVSYILAAGDNGLKLHAAYQCWISSK